MRIYVSVLSLVCHLSVLLLVAFVVVFTLLKSSGYVICSSLKSVLALRSLRSSVGCTTLPKYFRPMLGVVLNRCYLYCVVVFWHWLVGWLAG